MAQTRKFIEKQEMTLEEINGSILAASGSSRRPGTFLSPTALGVWDKHLKLRSDGNLCRSPKKMGDQVFKANAKCLPTKESGQRLDLPDYSVIRSAAKIEFSLPGKNLISIS